MESKVKEWLDEVTANAHTIETRYNKHAIATALSACISYMNVMVHDDESTAEDFKMGADKTYGIVKKILSGGREK